MSDTKDQPTGSGELQQLMATLFGSTPPPSKSKILAKKLGNVVGTILFLLLSVAFIVGLVDLIALLVRVTGSVL